MKQDELQEDEYLHRVRYINGKFDDPKFNIDGNTKYDFAFFKGTLREFDELKNKHNSIIHLLEWRFLTEDEIDLREIPIPNFNTQRTKDNEEKRYLRSGYNCSTPSLKSY